MILFSRVDIPFYLIFGYELKFLSLNVGMSAALAGLTTIITAQGLDIIFLQEVRLTSEQLGLLVGKLGFQASVNIDVENPTKPGTAIVWKNSLPIQDIFTLVSCRAQLAVLGPYMLLNIYAPNGSDKRFERFVGEISIVCLRQWILKEELGSIRSFVQL